MKCCKETGIYYIGEYHPYWLSGEKNPNFNKVNGGYILDLKENNKNGIRYFVNKIEEEFKKYSNIDEFNIITIVPSSKKNVISEGLKTLVNAIAENYDCMEYVQCLNRNRTVEKKANGGLRSKQLEIDTIDAINKKRINRANILLFDDVTTTGKSLIACKEILIKNGAKNVICIALGKTV